MNLWYEQIVNKFKEIEESWDLSTDVAINKKRLLELAKEWAEESFELPNWRVDSIYPFDTDDFVQWLGIVTSINACYRVSGSKEKFWTIWRNKKWTGAFAMQACTIRAIEEGFPILDTLYLSCISLYDMKDIFNRYSKLSLLEERRDVWRDIGVTLKAKYDGHFENLFKAADYRCFNNGQGICERLAYDFSLAFDDTRIMSRCSTLLPFYKKALLFPLIYYGRANDSKVLSQIKDIESISPVADYEIPKVLRLLGVFTYSDELVDKISRGDELPVDSFYEVSIRLVTVLAVQKLLEEINKERSSLGKEEINMAHLDFRLWNAGRGSKILHHITSTLDY